jgi:hypothetical protein
LGQSSFGSEPVAMGQGGGGAVRETIHPPAIGLRELVPWVALAAVLAMLVAFVAVADGSYVHEFFHDGRHLLAVPCD